MFLDEFHHESAEGITFSADQASQFAKRIAGDFNPIHDPDAKRFCVPGDLMFAMVLSRYGVNTSMEFTFEGMVGKDTPLIYPESPDNEFSISNAAGKNFMSVTRGGDLIQDPITVEKFIRQYVAFSGRNFPHILMPLMEKHNVIINPDRPLVIYESMTHTLDTIELDDPKLDMGGSELAVNGKRGDVKFHFVISENGKEIGRGYKKLVLSGLREYDAEVAKYLIDYYAQRKAEFTK